MAHNLDVIYEDNHVLVVNKPALLATMGVDSSSTSLVTLAKDYLKKRYNKPGNVYLGVVSRLDSFTSGLVVLARTSKAASRLSGQFLNRTTDKFYLCATDVFEAASADLTNENQEQWWERLPNRWTDWIWHDDANRRMRCVAGTSTSVQPQGAKLGELHWKGLGTAGSSQINLVKLSTGRKHQIRVQFSSRSLPIVGDKKYESSRGFPIGIALHSWLLRFKHPVRDELLTFSAPIPESWVSLGRFNAIRDPGGSEDSIQASCNGYLDRLARQWLASVSTRTDIEK